MMIPVLPADRERCDDFCARFREVKSEDVGSPGARVPGSENLPAGKLSEIVVGRVLGAAVDLRVYQGSDSGADLTLSDGRTLGIRGVPVQKRMDYNFTLPLRAHEKRPDLLLLALVAPDRGAVVIAGWLATVEFLRRAVVLHEWKGLESRFTRAALPVGVYRFGLRPFAELLTDSALAWERAYVEPLTSRMIR